MLLNLEYSLKCDAFIGTLASNWCRLVDEMRCTVGTYEHACVRLNDNVYENIYMICAYVNISSGVFVQLCACLCLV